MPSPPPPPPPTLAQLIQEGIQDTEKLIKWATPLIEEAYAFSQVLGNIMATEDNGQPPSTYYIACPDPSSPTTPGTTAPTGDGYQQVANISDPTASGPLQGVHLGVLAGPSMSDVAVAVYSSTSGHPAILIGGSGLGLAAVGSPSSATGAAILDEYPDNIAMGMPRSSNASGKHMLYTAQGTTAPPDDQTQGPGGALPGVLANKPDVLQQFTWMKVDYPALTFPMGPGVKSGHDDMVKQILATDGTFAICGYSQGAILTSQVWRDEILNPNGQLHHRLPDLFAHVTFGNPLRCPGIANGNGLVPIDVPTPSEGYVTGGIGGPDDLTPWQVPPWHLDFAHNGDVWTSAPVGADPWHDESPIGEAETSIYDLFMLKINGPDTLIPEIGKILTDPLVAGIGVIEGMVNMIGFFAQGMSAPHYTYDVQEPNASRSCLDAATEYIVNMGKLTPT